MPVANDAVWLDVLPSMDKFGPALTKGAASEADKAGRTSGGRFGKGMLAGIAVVAGGAALATKALYNIGATFDTMSDTIRTGTGATGKALDALNASAKNVGKTTPASFEDIGTAVADVNTRLGLTGKPLEKMSTQFLELSRITGTDVAANIENVSRVFGDWGVEADKQSESLDYLFKVSQSTGIGIDSLSQKVVQFGAPMRQFGFSFEESAALMGKWEKEGVNTETIMGGLRAGLGKLSKAGKDPAKAFGQITKQIQNAGSTGEATAIAIKTFGQRAGPDLAAAVREGRFDLEGLLGTLRGSSETIMSAGKDTMDFSETWLMFKNQVMVGLEPLATRVFAALGAGMEMVNRVGIPAMANLAGFVQDNKTAFTLLGIAIGVGTAGFVIYKVAVAASTAATKLHTAWTKRQIIVQKILNRVMRLNPLGLVITALTLLAAALVIAYKKSDTFRRIVDGAWKAIRTAISFAWNKVIKPIFLAYKTYLERVVFPVLRFLWNKVVKPVFEAIGDKIKKVWNNVIKPAFQALGSFLREKVVPAFRKGVKAIGDAWDGIKSAAAKPINFVIDTVYNNGLRKAFNEVMGFLKMKTRLPEMDTVGTGGSGLTVGKQQTFSAAGGAGRHSHRHEPSHLDAMGGPFGWVKKLGGKGFGWIRKKILGLVEGLVKKVPGGDFGKMAGASAMRMAHEAVDWIKGKFSGSPTIKAAKAGKAGTKGKVLPAGRYRIGMPYLGYPGHYGADYPAVTGTPVYAMSSGAVSRAASLTGSYGRHVYIEHPGGIQTRYAHLNSYGVRAGQQVRAGQMIGTVGSTGNSSGPHLHFEYRRNGSAVDPATLGIFDGGGLLKQGMLAYHAARKPDRVLTDAQWRDMHAIASRAAGAGTTIHQHFPATATPEAAAAASGGRIADALSSVGVV